MVRRVDQRSVVLFTFKCSHAKADLQAYLQELQAAVEAARSREATDDGADDEAVVTAMARVATAVAALQSDPDTGVNQHIGALVAELALHGKRGHGNIEHKAFKLASYGKPPAMFRCSAGLVGWHLLS